MDNKKVIRRFEGLVISPSSLVSVPTQTECRDVGSRSRRGSACVCASDCSSVEAGRPRVAAHSGAAGESSPHVARCRKYLLQCSIFTNSIAIERCWRILEQPVKVPTRGRCKLQKIPAAVKPPFAADSCCSSAGPALQGPLVGEL